MDKKHPAESKSMTGPGGDAAGSLSEHDRKKLELGDAMEHEHGRKREEIEEDIEELDARKPN